MIGSCFRKVIISGTYNEKNLPVLILANHVSWWDGFWVMYLNLALFKRRFHFMMLEEQLNRFTIFKACGGYPVRKGSRSIVETLNYTAGLLENSENLVLLFPQGKLRSQHSRDFAFEKGVEKIIAQVKSELQVFFVVNLTDYLSHRKPALFIYLKEYDGRNMSAAELSIDYAEFYYDCAEVNREKNPE